MAVNPHDSHLVADHQHRFQQLEDSLATLRAELGQLKISDGVRRGAEEEAVKEAEDSRRRLETWQARVDGKLDDIGSRVTVIDSRRHGALTTLRDVVMLVTLALAAFQIMRSSQQTHPSQYQGPTAPGEQSVGQQGRR